MIAIARVAAFPVKINRVLEVYIKPDSFLKLTVFEPHDPNRSQEVQLTETDPSTPLNP